MDKKTATTQKTGGTAKGTDVDPLAEAEVYLAYGRKEQATAILEEALRANPGRQDIRGRLREITPPPGPPGTLAGPIIATPQKGIYPGFSRDAAYFFAGLFTLVLAMDVAGLKLGLRFAFDYGPLSINIPHIEFEDPMTWEQLWPKLPMEIFKVSAGFLGAYALVFMFARGWGTQAMTWPGQKPLPALAERRLPDPIGKRLLRLGGITGTALIAGVVTQVASSGDSQLSLTVAVAAFFVAMILRDRLRSCPECGSRLRFHKRGSFSLYVPCFDCAQCSIRWVGKERDNTD